MKKLENTIENKSAFLKNYMFTGCCFEGISNSLWYLISDAINGCGVFLGDRGVVKIIDSPPLELTPISAISDEDAIEVAKIQFSFSDCSEVVFFHCKEVKNHCVKIIRGTSVLKTVSINEWSFNISASDFLRSKGYAIPWNGLSVEDLIDYNWIKLKPLTK